MSKILCPTSERIKEITQALMDPKNGVIRRLKVFRLTEKVAYVWFWAEDWPNPVNQRSQPRTVAAIVAWAELNKKIYNDALEDFQAKRRNFTVEDLRLPREINKIEDEELRFKRKIEKIETGQQLKNLLEKNRSMSFEQKRKFIKDYSTASVKMEFAKIKRDLIIKSKTRPRQKYFDGFCLDIKNIFFDRTEKSPNYKLIANIANLFNLTDVTQTSDTIRQRLYHLTK